MDAERRPRRSLIMAGGGVKVAFQAGVLQVWLDEAGIEFDHGDAASGGVFNLAMWCQGMSGTQIADNWRNYAPGRAIEPALGQLLRLLGAESFFRLGRMRRNVLRQDWGLDWAQIQGTPREATFNLYNFTRHRHEVVPAADMDEDRLISAVSLPMWFPPVSVDGDTYIDPVFVTDANLEEAIRRGADELWVIWTVSERGEWHHGFVAHYFQMIEAMANGQLRAVIRRIEESNERLARGQHAEFERPVTVRLLRAEVPLHYLINFAQDRYGAAVELGVRAGRRWCAEEGIALPPPEELARAQARQEARPTTVSFTEEMAGHLGLGRADYREGEREGRARGTSLMFHLTITVEDLARFMVDPDHEGGAQGWVGCDALGGRLPVERGVFNLFVNQADPADKRMLYQLWFHDGEGRALTLAGHKVVEDHPGFDLWSDTTTLFTRIVDGHVAMPDAEAASPVGAGILRISPAAFARQLTTFRSTGPSASGRIAGLFRFGRLFFGSLWDVYAREVLSSSPF